MLFMLIDRHNPNSFFKPYYDILPKTLSNMPIFWSDEELSYLKGSFLLTQIDERNLAIQADYEAICEVAPHFRDLSSLEDFKWARMAVCSRNFGIVVRGLRTAALVPYVLYYKAILLLLLHHDHLLFHRRVDLVLLLYSSSMVFFRRIC